MILTYRDFTLTGTVDECIEFIEKITTCTTSSNYKIEDLKDWEKYFKGENNE